MCFRIGQIAMLRKQNSSDPRNKKERTKKAEIKCSPFANESTKIQHPIYVYAAVRERRSCCFSSLIRLRIPKNKSLAHHTEQSSAEKPHHCDFASRPCCIALISGSFISACKTSRSSSLTYIFFKFLKSTKFRYFSRKKFLLKSLKRKCVSVHFSSDFFSKEKLVEVNLSFFFSNE